MIWRWLNEVPFEEIIAAIWRENQVTRPTPQVMAPPPRHTSKALRVPARRPVIRSWLGGRTTDPSLDPHLTQA